ncbi:aldo/keto reductase [Halovenus rubra]|uniref:Aldo/keto reductase n=2 Tax=Halovenus rubra TaxID=869890 RepID=A0ABD5XA13_9EURY|nr:aldo/keto reductase [Halovenus rubra]
MEFVTRCGDAVPKIGFGTWQMSSETAHDSVATALDLGYRHIDTAQAYDNEDGVGRAITESDVDREDIFLTTKVFPTNRTVDEIVTSTEESVAKLGVDAVDLLLIHWPHPLASVETVMAGLNAARDQGLTRHIGVSNFGKDRLETAREHSEAPIFTDQVLFHPWWPQRELLSYCQSQDIALTGYSPLANGAAIDDDLLWEIGEKHGKTGPQTALRWATQHKNVITIPMSTSRDHQAQNIDIFDFMLTEEQHENVTRPSYLKTGLGMIQGSI